MRALIVDDSTAMRSILRRMMEKLSYESVEASNGAEGLGLLMSEHFDLCLVDWNMPAMNGLDFIKSVRCNADFRRLPVILVTDESSPEKIEEALAAGADGHLPKPFEHEDLVAVMCKLGLRAA